MEAPAEPNSKKDYYTYNNDKILSFYLSAHSQRFVRVKVGKGVIVGAW